MAKAAAAEAGVAMPPAAPTRSGCSYPYCACKRSRRASSVGTSVMAGRLSVCPPESASAVTSWATGMRAARAACSGVEVALPD